MKYVWRFQKAVHIGIWTLLIYRGFNLKIIEGWYALGIFALLQMLQYVFYSAELGEINNFSRGQTMVMTLLFGYSWWYPLKNRNHHDPFSDSWR